MPKKTIQNVSLNLAERIEKSFKQYKVTAKGMRNFRLCIIIRLGISNDTYLRMMKHENFTYRELLTIAEIMGCSMSEI